MKKKEIIILGAGITGLTAAFILAKNGYKVKVLEKETLVGGLAGTIDWDGWKFDMGAHSFFSKSDDIKAFYKELLGDKFSDVELTAKLYIFEKLITYPLVGFQIFSSLDSRTMMRAGLDFFLTRLKALFFGIKKTQRLDEWIIRRFGKVLYGIYFSNYIARIQGKDPKYLSSDIGEKKIPIFSIRQYLKREFRGRKDIDTRNIFSGSHHYFTGGFGAVAEALREKILEMGGDISTNEAVTGIVVKDNKMVSIETTRDAYNCQYIPVISTLPLNFLAKAIKPGQIGKGIDMSALEYTKVPLLLVKVNKEKVMGYRWTNFSSDRFPFYRVSECSHDKFKTVPDKKCSLIFEMRQSRSENGYVAPGKDILETVLPLFNEVFKLHSDEIIDSRTILLDSAAPIMSIGYKEALYGVMSRILGIERLYSVGRQGLFTYINADGCAGIGIDIANSIIEGRAAKTNWELLNTFHGEKK